jgi:hypothetical protein
MWFSTEMGPFLTALKHSDKFARVGRVNLSPMPSFPPRPPASLYVAGPFAQGYTEFYNFLIPLYGLSLGMSAGSIGFG